MRCIFFFSLPMSIVFGLFMDLMNRAERICIYLHHQFEKKINKTSFKIVSLFSLFRFLNYFIVCIKCFKYLRIIFTDLLLVHGQSVEVYPKNVTAAEGQNATLLCRTSSPLLYCR